MRWAGNVETTGEMRNAKKKFLVGEHEGKIPRRRPRRSWENNIRTDFRQI